MIAWRKSENVALEQTQIAMIKLYFSAEVEMFSEMICSSGFPTCLTEYNCICNGNECDRIFSGW